MTEKQSDPVYRFADFTVDVAQRRLMREQRRLDVNGRYFDALVLLLENAGELVSKDTFMTTVWQGVVVSDEALTQCIRSLRRLLDDNARTPRFIETVPKYGYRFVGELKDAPGSSRPTMVSVASATLGAGAAGVVGGVLLGTGLSILGDNPVKLIPLIIALTAFVALLGGAAVSLGAFAAARYRSNLSMMVVGGALGGLVIGYLFHWTITATLAMTIGAEQLMLTGAPEGISLGAAAGFIIGLCKTTERPAAVCGVAVTVTAVVVSLWLSATGGKLMTQSLAGLAELPQSTAMTLVYLKQWLTAHGNRMTMIISIHFIEVWLFLSGIALALRLHQPIDQDKRVRSNTD